jgi:hypothetical protein
MKIVYPPEVQSVIDELTTLAEDAAKGVRKPYESDSVWPNVIEQMRYRESVLAAQEPYLKALEEVIRKAPYTIVLESPR